jgi:dTDP-D-glucose 4,6-dehydratase
MSAQNPLVTGGCGFIGANVIRYQAWIKAHYG